MGQQEDQRGLNRRTFLKTTGAGILGAAVCGLPAFRSYTLKEAMAAAKETGETAIPTFCGMCGPAAGCGIYAFVKNGVFTRVAGMKESPTNRGAVCPKGQAAPQWVYSPDRLKTPLRRVGAKGEGKFQEITWDDAIGIIAEKLKEQKKKYGPESLAMLSPARRSYCDYMQRFLIVHGSPNYGHSGICAAQRGFAFSYTLGGQPRCDYANSDVILVWGRQPFYSAPAQMLPRSYLAAKKRGAKIIAIKPSIEPDSGMADIWVPLRPGTDAALALSMLHVIVGENLIDEAFVEKYCYGYDKFKAHVQKYTPAWGEKITGVPAKQIQEVARIYATAKSAGIDLGNGVEHTPSSSDAIRGVAIMMAITGNLNRDSGGNKLGGGMGPGGGGRTKSVNLMERYTPEMVDKLVGPEFPKAFQPLGGGTTSAYYKILDSVLTEKPYPIRGLIAPGTQPTVSTRGTKRVIEALKKVDFYVVVDVARTADMDYADIVLPTSTVYESDHPFESMGGKIMARRKIIEPLGPYKSIFEFFLDLGVAMGYGDDFWGGSMTACMNDLLSPLNITIDDVRKHPLGIAPQASGGASGGRGGGGGGSNLENVFKGKSGQLDGAPYLAQGKVAIYNTNFEREGFSPMPEWREPPESVTGTPELTEKYPLTLSDYHTSKCYSASWQRNVPYLREVQPYPMLHIHPDTAAARGIKNNDWIIVEGPHGWMKVMAELYPGIRPDTVMMLHGWWQGCKELGIDDFPIADGGANVNNMYSVDPETSMDPLVTANTSQTLVEVRKA